MFAISEMCFPPTPEQLEHKNETANKPGVENDGSKGVLAVKNRQLKLQSGNRIDEQPQHGC